MRVHLTTPDTAEVITVGTQTIRVLEDGSRTGHRIGLVELSLPPGSPGPPQHVHREHDETFFVLSGTVRFTSGADHLDVPAGDLVTAPIGTPHTFSNPDRTQPATMLCTVTPDRYIEYFRELGRLAEAGESGHPSAILEVMSRYATEPYRP
ncbi:cupin domain-containing protein [Dactylosporangium sp. CA-139066]|uniref:cupin domain-containing protein n=1 Tax=Dactylosporangium sp. CA-139066 TaxID=3239930 RepID=UPI003D92B564